MIKCMVLITNTIRDRGSNINSKMDSVSITDVIGSKNMFMQSAYPE